MVGFFSGLRFSGQRLQAMRPVRCKDFWVALIQNDEDLMPLTPVRREAAHIQCTPSEWREEP